jgi:signal transduction histidine kinase
MLRHLAICAALLVVWILRRELQVRSSVVAVLALAALLNVASSCISLRSRWAVSAHVISPVLALGGWAALMSLTGGVASPMMVGFWLELVFSAMVFPPGGTLLVSCGVIAAIWLQQEIRGPGGGSGRLWLHTVFVAALGIITFLASRRWNQLHQSLAVESRALRRRLDDLEGELDATRTLGQVGERVARLAHSVKGTVQSLRGFAALMEGPHDGIPRREVLDGLRIAIDHLETTARTALGRQSTGGRPAEWTSNTELRCTLREVLAEVRRQHGGLRWIEPILEGLPAVALSAEVLREVMLIVTRNAAEASGPTGEVILRADVEGTVLRLSVQDCGAGIDPRVREKLFNPGVTTKVSGSGFGLFLARRLLEPRGGQITVGPGKDGGALFSVRVPVLQS